uniref:Uncharacterized protein n=1 Tax=Suricata suricatta TaxID=37032 RepID=A0A673TYI5_SURSU
MREKRKAKPLQKGHFHSLSFILLLLTCFYYYLREKEKGEDPLTKVLESSMQSNLYKCPWPLAFLISIPVTSMGTQASSLLGPLPHLSSFFLQPPQPLFLPCGSVARRGFQEDGTDAESAKQFLIMSTVTKPSDKCSGFIYSSCSVSQSTS